MTNKELRLALKEALKAGDIHSIEDGDIYCYGTSCSSCGASEACSYICREGRDKAVERIRSLMAPQLSFKKLYY